MVIICVKLAAAANILFDQIRVLRQYVQCIGDNDVGMVSEQVGQILDLKRQNNRIVATNEQSRPIVAELNRAGFNSRRIQWLWQSLNIFA
jgi:hypothetical protein